MSAPLLSVSGLGRAFGGLKAVDALDLTVADGEVVGLIGPNGSGKTTALNLISGALAPDRGAIVFAGHDVSRLAAYRIARLGLARTFQLVRVLDGMSCGENVEAGLAFAPDGPGWGAAADRRAAALLDRVGLGGRASQGARELTYVDRKRLELARALALSPRLILLDEWLAGLNPTELEGGIALLRSLAKGDGIAILLVEHVMDAIRSLCGRCIVMSGGRKIAEGTAEEVLSDPIVVEAYLGGDDARG